MRIIIAGLLTVCLMAPTGAPAKSEADAPNVQAAADYLVHAQGWYRGKVPTDLGLRKRIVRNGWQWREGRASTAVNFTGIIALALLDAHERLGRPEYLDAALLYGMALVNDFREFRSLTLPFRPDLELLVRLSEVTKDPSYKEAAAAWYTNFKQASPKGKDELRRVIEGRAGPKARPLTGYEMAFAVHAALAVGDTAHALDLADSAWQGRRSWMAKSVKAAGSWDLLSRAALLRALSLCDETRYEVAIRQLTDDLVGSQLKDGSWSGGSTQTTAYALRALLRAAPDDKLARAATARAAAWLSGSLGSNGAWPEAAGAEATNLEVQAEALTAWLAYLDRT